MWTFEDLSTVLALNVGIRRRKRLLIDLSVPLLLGVSVLKGGLIVLLVVYVWRSEGLFTFLVLSLSVGSLK